MTTKEEMFVAGVDLMKRFCAHNDLPEPALKRLQSSDRLYQLATCAFYRPRTITIMVEKCAHRGFGGRAWSWPGYAVDRTPYGVIQHELGHHVDELRFRPRDDVFSRRIYQSSLEAPLTGYLGASGGSDLTFFMEWFAENFRLFVTNPELSKALRPLFYAAVCAEGLRPLHTNPWQAELLELGANDRILSQAGKKVEHEKTLL